MAWRSESDGRGLGCPSSRSAALYLALAALVTAGFAVAGLIVRPNMYSDSGWGFLGWYAQAPTLPFNHAMALDLSDIAHGVDTFMATWTPGQHMLPGLLERLGLDLGQAIVVVVTIFSALGLGGWFVLYRALGFPSSSAALTVLIVACSRFYGQPFTNYNGGEVLLFGTAPWFLLLVWSLRSLGWFAVFPFLAGTAVLVFMKLTGIVVCAAAVGAAAICGDEAWRHRETIRKLVVAGVTIGLMAGIFYYTWYVRGVTAASISSAVHQDGAMFYIAFALVSLWSASFSLLDLASYLLLNPGRPVLETIDLVVYLLLPLALAAFAVTWVRLYRGHGEYLRFAVAIAGAMVAFLLLMWLSGKSISVEERHLKSHRCCFSVAWSTLSCPVDGQRCCCPLPSSQSCLRSMGWHPSWRASRRTRAMRWATAASDTWWRRRRRSLSSARSMFRGRTHKRHSFSCRRPRWPWRCGRCEAGPIMPTSSRSNI